jgi:hypothetical protein
MTPKWRQMADIYKRFAVDYPRADFSEEAAKEMFYYESTGAARPKSSNGYMLGKKWMDVTVKMWREDIRDGLLLRRELDYPEWFLDRVL